jgi:hypothetical protein
MNLSETDLDDLIKVIAPGIPPALGPYWEELVDRIDDLETQLAHGY